MALIAPLARVTLSTNRSTLGASTAGHPATVRNIALGTASVREANTLARVGPVCPRVRARRPGRTGRAACPTSLPSEFAASDLPLQVAAHCRNLPLSKRSCSMSCLSMQQACVNLELGGDSGPGAASASAVGAPEFS
jgi:hypothetical protein